MPFITGKKRRKVENVIAKAVVVKHLVTVFLFFLFYFSPGGKWEREKAGNLFNNKFDSNIFKKFAPATKI